MSSGRKGPPPPPHTNSGSSSTGSRAMVWIAAVIFGVPTLAFLSAVGYVIAGHIS